MRIQCAVGRLGKRAIWCGVIVCASTAGRAEEAVPLRNAYWSLTAIDGQLREVKADPGGAGTVTIPLWTEWNCRSFWSSGMVERDDSHVRFGGNWVGIGGEVPIAPTRTFALAVGAGSTVAVSIDCPADQWVSRLKLYVATHLTKDSALTVQIRDGAAAGAVLYEERVDPVVDNSTITIERHFTTARTLWVAITQTRGPIAWWSANGQPPAGVRVTMDGAAKPDLLPGLDVQFSKVLQPATLEYRLDGADLVATLRTDGPRKPDALPHAQWDGVTRWTRDGYDVTPATAAFRAYHTAAGQYITAHQMKRRDFLGLQLSPSGRIVARGAADADLALEADTIAMPQLIVQRGLLRHDFATTLTSGAADAQLAALVRMRLSRAGAPPEIFPRFATSDGATGETTTDFYWERGLSYPPAPGPIPWAEWNGLIRDWLDLPAMRDAERAVVGTVPLTPEGYVYTWGGEVGWPFPDPKKYDTRHFDTNARFILGAYRWITWRRDRDFLREQLPRLRRAMNYQLGPLQGEKGILITNSRDHTGKQGGMGGNYWDILPFGHKDAYSNVVFFASLRAMREMEQLATAWKVKSGAATPASNAAAPSSQPAVRSPADYDALIERCRRVYNETFWDDRAGRYIGCIDIDGVRHDYGFTFVNLEAMAYGLATREQARRIYHWMEFEPTSTGRADTYSAFEFAPRATTFHNPIVDDAEDIRRAGRPPWWHLVWKGTPFGDQCQDGGAILYTSYYDLMARATLIDATDAWKRYQAILERYRKPDRLCGGNPLFGGARPQQEDAGAAGVDLPFPESGLVPAAMLYVFMGVMPEADGLRITPRLPEGIDWVSAGPIAWGEASLRLRVTRASVEIQATRAGKTQTLMLTYASDRQVLIRPEALGLQ